MLRSRAITPDALHEFQMPDHAIKLYGERPSPSFDREKKIKEEWFNNTDVERKTARWCLRCVMRERVGQFLHGELSVRQPVSLIPCDNIMGVTHPTSTS